MADLWAEDAALWEMYPVLMRLGEVSSIIAVCASQGVKAP